MRGKRRKVKALLIISTISLMLFSGCLSSPNEKVVGEKHITDNSNNSSNSNIEEANSDLIKQINLKNISDSEIIELFLNESGMKEKYRTWNFSISVKTLTGDKLSVDLYAYKGEWESVNKISFLLDSKGEISELHVYPYIKTSMPSPLSSEERERVLNLVFNNSEVKKIVAGRGFEIWQMSKFVNPFTGKERGIEIYLSINDSKETYVISLKDNNVSIINLHFWREEGLVFFRE
ncbi:MAG: hypothetical protein H0Z28_04320 [Archaeoglobus sp.]|nr:hypothetical protein [Archaeoglobus sp.]